MTSDDGSGELVSIPIEKVLNPGSFEISQANSFSGIIFCVSLLAFVVGWIIEYIYQHLIANSSPLFLASCYIIFLDKGLIVQLSPPHTDT